MEQIPQIVEAAGGMSTQTLLWIIAGLMTVITVLGNVAKSLVDRRVNPLNGTLIKLDTTLGQVNTTLAKVDVRAEDSNRILTNHTEKLVVMGTAMVQLAANEAEQTRALVGMQPAIEASITGSANRVTKELLAALDAK